MAPEIERTEAVHPEVARALRALSGMERLRLAHETWELTRDRLTAYVAAKHPGWSRDQIRQDVARRLLDLDARDLIRSADELGVRVLRNHLRKQTE